MALSMCHDYYNPTHDQIAASGGPRGIARGPGRSAGVFLEILPEGLYPTPTLCPAGPQDLLQDGLPRAHPDAPRLLRTPRRSRPGQGSALLHALQGPEAAAKKGEPVFLLITATVRAQERGLIGSQPEAAVDATGLDSQHTSCYYFARCGRKQ